MTQNLTITEFRTELSMTMSEFAAAIGLASKANVSVIERDNRCGLKVALRIEELSGGRVDAAIINEDVALARAACLGGCEAVSAVHADDVSSEMDVLSAGKAGEISRARTQEQAA
jgi:DNA-binding XRE family transcriptional regulator